MAVIVMINRMRRLQTRLCTIGKLVLNTMHAQFVTHFGHGGGGGGDDDQNEETAEKALHQHACPSTRPGLASCASCLCLCLQHLGSETQCRHAPC